MVASVAVDEPGRHETRAGSPRGIRLAQGEEHTADVTLFPEDYLWGGGAAALTLKDFVIRRGDGQ